LASSKDGIQAEPILYSTVTTENLHVLFDDSQHDIAGLLGLDFQELNEIFVARIAHIKAVFFAGVFLADLALFKVLWHGKSAKATKLIIM
jgi:hypothetical protein